MQIEIAEPGRMTQTGSSLIKLIQNNHMPVLDLLVRESIQNSLDARLENSKYVEVSFIPGTFSNSRLCPEFDNIKSSLQAKYGNNSYEFLAIRDTFTVGLTGEMDYKKVKDNKYGNLLKLVYEICKPQEAEGAGGSWGIGKTVYFRIGIGLVIYYSRIHNEDGSYESRLAASLVENETDPNAMIPTYNDMSKRGIAWWGKSVGENVTQPITDEKYIGRFLDIFGLEPYSDEQTGTTIIIPYINSEELLANNRIEYLNDQDQILTPFWCRNLKDYLSISAQRWYAPRLNNPHYQQGAYLKIKLGKDGIGRDSMEPVFKVIQSLYNRASYVNEDDILTDVENKYIEPVKIRKYLKDTTSGVVAFTKVSRDILHMNAPEYKPAPFMYFNNEMSDSDSNRPTICFTRKPAMIVSYENTGAWVSGIPSSSKDEYIIGIFVLNSYNTLVDRPKGETLEEYIRKSELADHTSWNDWSQGSYNPRFVSKIQSNLNKIVSREFHEVQDIPQAKTNSGLGKLFGDLILPPEGFGTKAGPVTPPQPKPTETRTRFKFAIDKGDTRYSSSKMVIPLVLETSAKKKISSTGFSIQIDSETKKIFITEWEEKMGLISPFEISDILLRIQNIDGVEYNDTYNIQPDGSTEVSDIMFTPQKTGLGTWCGLKLSSLNPHHLKIKLFVTVSLKRKDIKPAFAFEKGV